jgi:uncharacterized protein (DUF1697 family)
MAVMISMLRGVNVGAHHRMAMAELRAVHESLGHQDVQTYIQSGNVIFRARNASAAGIETAIEKKFGFRPLVILRTPEQLRSVMARNPFESVDPSRLLVWFLAGDPGEEARERVRALPPAPEQVRVDGSEIYIYYPNGMARPKLSMEALGRAVKIPGTGRNWNTVSKLLEIAEAMSRG